MSDTVLGNTCIQQTHFPVEFPDEDDQAFCTELEIASCMVAAIRATYVLSTTTSDVQKAAVTDEQY